MRLANVAGRATLVVDGGGIDVAEASHECFGPDLASAYAHWAAFRTFADGLDARPTFEIDPSLLCPPSPSPTQVFAVGLNYRAHAAETGAELPSFPATFTKFPSALTGPFAEVRLGVPTVDWEVELVVVIGTRAEQVDASRAWEHIAGLTIGQDLSDRVLQRAAGAHFSLGKSRPGFGPMGPHLVTIDELEDPMDLALGCSVNGEVVQQSSTADLVFSVPELIATLSGVLPLLPGDVIFTGTPSGVGTARTPPRYLASGDVLESWIEGIGTMRNQML